MLKPLAIGTARKAGVLKLERRSLLDEPMSKGVRFTACSAYTQVSCIVCLRWIKDSKIDEEH